MQHNCEESLCGIENLKKVPPPRARWRDSLAVFIPVGLDLACQRDNGVVWRVMSINAGFGGIHIPGAEKKTHSAGKLPLNRPGSRGNSVGNVLCQQQIPERKSLLIVRKEDVIPDIGISH